MNKVSLRIIYIDKINFEYFIVMLHLFNQNYKEYNLEEEPLREGILDYI